MTLTEQQKDQLAAVLSEDERRGAVQIHIDPIAYATSAFEIWRRDPANQGFVGDGAISAFVGARKAALSTMATIPIDSLVLLKAMEGTDPIAICKRWKLSRR
jgi:hypothetical protein